LCLAYLDKTSSAQQTQDASIPGVSGDADGDIERIAWQICAQVGDGGVVYEKQYRHDRTQWP